MAKLLHGVKYTSYFIKKLKYGTELHRMVMSEGCFVLLLGWKLGQTGVGYLFWRCTGAFFPQRITT
jgi:hypothetical protein